MTQTPEQIAAGLSARMRRALLTPPAYKTVRTDHCCVPGNEHTALALWRRGLVEEPYSVIYTITPTGLAVRAILQAQEQTNAD